MWENPRGNGGRVVELGRFITFTAVLKVKSLDHVMVERWSSDGRVVECPFTAGLQYFPNEPKTKQKKLGAFTTCYKHAVKVPSTTRPPLDHHSTAPWSSDFPFKTAVKLPKPPPLDHSTTDSPRILPQDVHRPTGAALNYMAELPRPRHCQRSATSSSPPPSPKTHHPS